MELNKNLVKVQAALVSCAKEIGDFTRINYVGGESSLFSYQILESCKLKEMRRIF